MAILIRKEELDELYHHGILGQKWGIRRFQNKDGTLTSAGKERIKERSLIIENKKPYEQMTDAERKQQQLNDIANNASDRSFFVKEKILPAGMKMYRATSDENENLTSGTAYVNYLDVDRMKYNAGWIKRNGEKDNYEVEYTLTEDLRIPSKKEQYNTIYDLIKNDQNFVTNALKEDIGTNEATKKYYENSPEGFDAAVRKIGEDYVINQSKEYAVECIAKRLWYTPKAKDKIISELSKKGFNAMTDIASIGNPNSSYDEDWYTDRREGIDSLILFDASSMKRTSATRVTKDDEAEYLKKTMDHRRNKWNVEYYHQGKKDIVWSDQYSLALYHNRNGNN